MEDPGTSLVTISGAVELPGVVEIDRGTPLIDDRASRPRRRLATGSPGGGLRRGLGGTAHFATPYAVASLRAVGASAGVGIVVALGPEACGMAETARVADYMAAQSAGQCGPCVYGLPAIARRRGAPARGQGDPDLLARLERRVAEVNGRGACRHPDGAVNLVRSALRVFADDVHDHAAGRPAAREPAVPTPLPRTVREVTQMIRILVDPVACDAYGFCAELLPEAISLDEWGYPIVDGDPLPVELVDAAKRAARDCPRPAPSRFAGGRSTP